MVMDIHPDTPVFEYNEIIDGIYIGTNQCCQVHFDKELLAKGITADISLEKERLDAPFGVESFLWLPTPDEFPSSVDQLTLGVRMISQLIGQGKKVYVHCKNGHGRAPTLVAAYLVSRGQTAKEAFVFLKQKRPSIHLHKAQEEAIENFAGKN
jgi:protein-tyrosine phosphatase